jgi:hypothetical protein
MEVITKSTKPTFVISAETATLISAFSRMKVGEVMTHEAMREIIKGGNHRTLIPTVKLALQRDLNMVIASVAGVGYKVLSADEVLAKGDDYRSRVRQANRRRVNELKTIDLSELLQPQQTRYHFEVSHTSMMHFLHSKGQQSHMLEASAQVMPKPAETLTIEQYKKLFSIQ